MSPTSAHRIRIIYFSTNLSKICFNGRSEYPFEFWKVHVQWMQHGFQKGWNTQSIIMSILSNHRHVAKFLDQSLQVLYPWILVRQLEIVIMNTIRPLTCTTWSCIQISRRKFFLLAPSCWPLASNMFLYA